jgi:hypothetical protein
MTTEHLIYGEGVAFPTESVNTMTFGKAALVIGMDVQKIARLRKSGKIMCPHQPDCVYVARYVAKDGTRTFGLIAMGSAGELPLLE